MQISLEEYLNNPSAENLLTLGANRAQLIAESLARSCPTESLAVVSPTAEKDLPSAFKVAGLYTTVSACHVDGCGGEVEGAVEQTVGEFCTSHTRSNNKCLH